MRDAEADMLNILENEYKKAPFSGVIHCFTGSSMFAERLLKIGFFFSISGIITFKKNDKLRETVSQIPIDQLLIETDSPYLAPEPLRGKINEPANITHTLEFMAKLFNLNKEDMGVKTSNNFFRLFTKAER